MSDKRLVQLDQMTSDIVEYLPQSEVIGGHFWPLQAQLKRKHGLDVSLSKDVLGFDEETRVVVADEIFVYLGGLVGETLTQADLDALRSDYGHLTEA